MTPPLRFGIVHDFRCPPGSEISMPQVYSETFEQIEHAEQLGLDLCWFTEHHFIEDGYLPNFVPVAAAAASRTTTMRFSTDICLLPFRHPISLAEDLAILDNISNGRMELGVGMGYATHEFQGFDIPISRRVSLTEEALQVLQLAWGGEAFNFEGKRYRFSNLRVTPDPVQEGGPPLWLAATSPAGAKRAATFGTHLLPQGPKSLTIDPWREEVGDTSDRRVGLIRGVFVTDDPEREWAPIAAAERYRRDVYVGLIKASQDHKSEIASRSESSKARRPSLVADTPIPLNPLVWTVGDADHCVGELQELIINNGITDLVTWGGPPGLAPSVMNDSLTKFAQDVIPRLRSR
jgi:alkanesulfonate monooxygenase SsuD/methylene tetrahydromethanopterin reductase-like flavin-dependent oxidoreductase (luciferase family)|tara:strand:+ start:1284 stop:2330 length:1047 start_codon:yes stop_codon:yes gene_type:complete